MAYFSPSSSLFFKTNTADDFLDLAGDFNGGGTSNCYGIGNLAGRYLLNKDINGILENQKDNCFFGFCFYFFSIIRNIMDNFI